ncbi:hypothetical protein SADUNF_Sadunf03G0022100 [Salix dunnii]|uniref:Uncharacterized protein n=1 Tax=Salix dunnii TaxID=1413687 RepID=A0A835K6M7_9ROSI|nr:hypothetical protein SADUNF_Sadunf03G0022100 [Salix dunnii]
MVSEDLAFEDCNSLIKTCVIKFFLVHIKYITYLIRFKDQLFMYGAFSTRNHQFLSTLHQRFMDIFNPKLRRLSVYKVDLVISYVLTFPADISNDLRMNLVIVNIDFHNLGIASIAATIVCSSSAPGSSSMNQEVMFGFSLYADDFWIFPADISNDLRMNFAIVKTHFCNLGSEIERKKHKYLVTLSVPLEFPQPYRKFQK